MILDFPDVIMIACGVWIGINLKQISDGVIQGIKEYLQERKLHIFINYKNSQDEKLKEWADHMTGEKTSQRLKNKGIGNKGVNSK